MERFDLLESVRRYERERAEYQRLEEERKRKMLTPEDFRWKPLYYNKRYCRSDRENGFYSLFVKEKNGKTEGLRISIVYQVEEIQPFGHKSDAPIELFVVFEKRYDEIKATAKPRLMQQHCRQ